MKAPKARSNAPVDAAEIAEPIEAAEPVEAAPVEARVNTNAAMRRITVLEEIKPAPVVGRYNFGLEHSIDRLEAKKTYRCPADVAARLQDTGLVVMLED